MDRQAILCDALVEIRDAIPRLQRVANVIADEIAANRTWAAEDFSKNTRTGVSGLPCSGTLEFGREAPNDDPIPPHELLTHTVALDEDAVEKIASCGE